MGVQVMGSNKIGWVVKNCVDIELAQAAILQAGGTRGSTFEMISPVCVFDPAQSTQITVSAPSYLERLCVSCIHSFWTPSLKSWQCENIARRGFDPVTGILACNDARKNTADGFCGRDGEFFHPKD